VSGDVSRTVSDHVRLFQISGDGYLQQDYSSQAPAGVRSNIVASIFIYDRVASHTAALPRRSFPCTNKGPHPEAATFPLCLPVLSWALLLNKLPTAKTHTQPHLFQPIPSRWRSQYKKFSRMLNMEWALITTSLKKLPFRLNQICYGAGYDTNSVSHFRSSSAHSS